jgi:hypothetical protein
MMQGQNLVDKSELQRSLLIIPVATARSSAACRRLYCMQCRKVRKNVICMVEYGGETNGEVSEPGPNTRVGQDVSVGGFSGFDLMSPQDSLGSLFII